MSGGRRIAVVTGSRADYGLLRPLLRALDAHDGFELRTVVTGMHLEPRFGDTWRAIEADGLAIEARVPTGLVDDAPTTLAAAMGRGVAGCGEAFAALAPDLVVVLGDRFEILAAVSAALVHRIPVAHLCGGDVTEGAWDEGIRHAISKLAHLHFPTHADAARRLIAMGEPPDRVHAVGSTGIDTLLATELLDRTALEADLGFRLRERNVLVTFHPETLAPDLGVADADELLAALDALGDGVGLLFTLPNADSGGAAVRARIESFMAGHGNARAWTSLGQLRYLSAMKHVDAVVGNSSSGLYEAPSLRVPTVNVGGRQDGRARAASVLDVPPERTQIERAVRAAFTLDCGAAVNPYGDGRAVPRIVAVLEATTNFRTLLRKGFHEEARP